MKTMVKQNKEMYIHALYTCVLHIYSHIEDVLYYFQRLTNNYMQDVSM